MARHLAAAGQDVTLMRYGQSSLAAMPPWNAISSNFCRAAAFYLLME
ncbi:hypothetical protein [Paenibacillus sp. MER TA 81-3]|nr:hypothetical protein [Paenibacillus sp. MER TA 81-3]